VHQTAIKTPSPNPKVLSSQPMGHFWPANDVFLAPKVTQI